MIDLDVLWILGSFVEGNRFDRKHDFKYAQMINKFDTFPALR